jgi:hypothetical protein
VSLLSNNSEINIDSLPKIEVVFVQFESKRGFWASGGYSHDFEAMDNFLGSG